MEDQHVELVYDSFQPIVVEHSLIVSPQELIEEHMTLLLTNVGIPAAEVREGRGPDGKAEDLDGYSYASAAAAMRLFEGHITDLRQRMVEQLRNMFIYGR